VWRLDNKTIHFTQNKNINVEKAHAEMPNSESNMYTIFISGIKYVYVYAKKIISAITYSVSSGPLNPTIPIAI